MTNLKQLGIALQIYHDEWKCFPPAYVADESGAPAHSWRTLILPYLDQAALYEQIDFSEPWNSPNNRPLADTDPYVFRCPSDAAAGQFDTNYVAVVGPGTAWPGETCSKLSDFKDGTSNTILLVEVVNPGIRWAEPRDLHIVQMPMFLNPTLGQGPASNHAQGLNVLFADGSVRFLSDNTTSEELRALLTIAGGESVP
jgi:prepilin-type processing-associated H-X9-DG protein